MHTHAYTHFFLLHVISWSVSSIVISFDFQGKVYQFDSILKPNVTQEKVYNTAARDIVKGKKFLHSSADMNLRNLVATLIYIR